jgi:hypothetical protein
MFSIRLDEWMEYPQIESASWILGKLEEHFEVHFSVLCYKTHRHLSLAKQSRYSIETKISFV